MKIMKQTFLLSLIILSCASTNKVILKKGSENWSEFHAGNNKTIKFDYIIYQEGNDTLTLFTNYYQNGMLKSKVIMKNEFLMEIEYVLDTLGNKLNFGQLVNGSGYIVQFRDDNGKPESEGQYIDGNKEGWWKRYHFTGTILDSIYYINGYSQYDSPQSALEVLLDEFGLLKNNLYR